jgi:integrase/recombinase XerD
MVENYSAVGTAQPQSQPVLNQILVPQAGLIGPPSDRRTGQLVAAFSQYQARRGLSAATQTAYGQYLAQFVAWLGTRPLQTVRPADIELGYLPCWDGGFRDRYGRSPSRRTIRNNLVALNSFFAFLARFEHVTMNPMAQIERPRIVQRRNDRLSTSESDALLAACRTPAERIVVPLLLWTGMRGGEAESLLKRDVDLPQRLIVVRQSKTPTGLRTIPILHPLVGPIGSWLAHQAELGLDDPDSPFLATRSGRPMRHAQVWTVVKRVSGRAGIRERTATDYNRRNLSQVSPHTLRRTFGSDLINRGVRLEVVAKLLGHAQTTTTERCYAELLQTTVVMEALRAYEDHDGRP